MWKFSADLLRGIGAREAIISVIPALPSPLAKGFDPLPLLMNRKTLLTS